MNFRDRNTYDVIEKFKKFRSIFDKLFIIFSGCLWIFSTIWDIYQLQRHWLDYAMEFYSSFFIFFMMIYSINPKSLPKKIYTSFRLMTSIKGRGTLFIIIASIFLSDKHALHKFCAIIFLLGGILYFICEILVPTTKEELDNVEMIFNPKKDKKKNKNTTEVKISNISINTQINTTTEGLTGSINNQINLNEKQNDMNKNNSINITQTILIDESHANKNLENNGENNNKNNAIIYEDEIVRKTDNPYEIPEDF